MATTWVALLRAVNVGGHNKVPMAELRSMLEGLGYGDVRTLVQSGNAVFTAGATKAAALEEALADALASTFDVRVPVLVRTAAQLAKVVKANPYVGAGVDTKPLHVAFLSAKPDAAKVKAIDRSSFAPEEFEVGDRVLYLNAPNGLGRSRLPNWDRVLGLTATIRNWNTVTTLHEMAAGRS